MRETLTIPSDKLTILRDYFALFSSALAQNYDKAAKTATTGEAARLMLSLASGQLVITRSLLAVLSRLIKLNEMQIPLDLDLIATAFGQEYEAEVIELVKQTNEAAAA